MKFEAHANLIWIMILTTFWFVSVCLSYFLFDFSKSLFFLACVGLVLSLWYLNRMIALNKQTILFGDDSLRLSFPKGFCLTQKNFTMIELKYSEIQKSEYFGGVNGELVIFTDNGKLTFYHFPNGEKITQVFSDKLKMHSL